MAVQRCFSWANSDWVLGTALSARRGHRNAASPVREARHTTRSPALDSPLLADLVNLERVANVADDSLRQGEPPTS